jgi:hypothetical protein
VVQEYGHDEQDLRGFTPRLAGIRRLIEAGRIVEARAALDKSPGEVPGLVDLVRLELNVAAREIEPATALSRVIAFLERSPRHPAAMAIYNQLSLLQYQEGRSCPSFSHPPPRR